MQRNYYPNITYLAKGFADYATAVLQDTLTRNQKASLVVPGGNTPCHYLPALASCSLPWHKITVTLSDERWVDVNTEGSNEHLVKKYLLAHLPENTCFVSLKTSHHTPFEAIDEIHQRIKNLPLPFSLTVLGLGEDGHIASLFPGMNPDSATTRHCIAVDQPIAPSPRMSLSLTALANSKHIALVVVGKAKRQILDRLNEHPDPQVPFMWLLQLSQAPITIFETDAI